MPGGVAFVLICVGGYALGCLASYLRTGRRISLAAYAFNVVFIGLLVSAWLDR